MQVEEIVLASEILDKNPEIYKEILLTFKKFNMEPNVVLVSHEEFKKITHKSEVIVRTGECTPYANIILKSGVVF